MREPIHESDGSECGATFHVDDDGAKQVSVRFDSRGTTAGTRAYRRGMVLMLRRLASLGVVVHWIAIETKTTGHLSLEERTLRLPWSYPLALADLVGDDDDADQLRAAIHTAAARAGRAPTAKGGGNGTKRLRLCVDLDTATLLTETIRDGHVALERSA